MSKKAPPGYRPVGARALKSASDTLRPYLLGAQAIDLFAGSGRFGLMALEEGAEHVLFVERDRHLAQELRRYLARHEGQATIHCQDVLTYLNAANPDPRFDIAFADPPFPLWNAAFSERLFSSLSKHLKGGAIFLVKYPARVVASHAFSGFRLWKSTPFGESLLMYFRYGESKSTSEEQ